MYVLYRIKQQYKYMCMYDMWHDLQRNYIYMIKAIKIKK
jgi:hypothetical protein